MTNEFMANELKVTLLMVLEKHLLIIDDHSSHCYIEFLQLAEVHNIDIVFLPSYAIHHLQHVDIVIVMPLANAYSLELDKW